MAADPNQDFSQFVREVVLEEQQKASASAGTQQQQQVVTPQAQPLTIKVGDKSLTYNSLQELESSLNQFVGSTASQMAQLQQKVAEHDKQGSYVTGDETPKWSDEAFIEKMQKSPKDAMEYAFNQLIFEGKATDAPGELRARLEEFENTKRTLAVYQFKEAHPEFPGGAENANKIEQIRQQMNLPYDANGLDAAYLMGINKGFLPNFYAQRQQAAAQAQQAQQLQQSGEYQQPPQNWQNPYDQTQFQGQPQYPGQVDPRQWNGGTGLAPAPGFNLPPQFANNPYLNAPPGVNRNMPSQMGGGFNPDDLSVEQIENVFARMGKPIQR